MKLSKWVVAACILIALLGVSLIDLFAKPWRALKARELLTRAEQAVCYEQSETVEKLLTAADAVIPDNMKGERDRIHADQLRVQNDLVFAREYFASCGNQERTTVLAALEKEYATPKEALAQALELANKGERSYAIQLVQLAEKQNPDYTGVKNMKEYLNIK